MDLMAMKSSRRKQSKPIRVSYNDDSEMPLAPPTGEEELVNGDNMDTSELGEEKENELHMSNVTACSKCAETFPNLEQLSEHVKNVHSDTQESSPLNLVRDFSSFPTAYHRLGSEFFMKNSVVSNGHKTENPVLDDENNIDKNGNDVVDGEFGEENSRYDDEKKDRSGIFHPDAYCELCDKEFCNKYFLKTHKANKHGIYDNSTSPFTTGVNPLPPSLVLPQDYSPLPYKLNLDFPLPPLKNPAYPTKPPTPQLTPSLLHSSSPSRQSPPTTQPLSQTSKPSHSPMSSAKPKSSLITPTSSSGSTSENTEKKPGQDMEDFCEICQKHFCNKYYLKKHKNDVHGIAPPDAPLSSGKRGGRPPNSELKLPPTPVTSDSPLIPHSLANIPGLPNMPGVMVLNPFLPPVLIPAGSLMNQHGPLPPRPPHLPMSSAFPFSSSSSAPVTTQSDSKSLSPGSSSTLATSSSPTGSFSSETLRNMGIPIPDGASPTEALRRMGLLSPDGQIASEALRGMGILNTEAFCDICRKEFCNKYFLKVHKANKHGIYIDEPLLPPSMAAAMGMSLPTKPSDLTTTSESANLSSDKEKEPCDTRVESSPKSSTPVSQSSDYIVSCSICKIEFASKYAYRVHRIQAHGMINEPFNESELAEEAFKLHNGDLPKQVSSKIAEEISAIERNAEASGFSTMFGSMVAAKLADRVNCDICNKELCNKYFLKAHKMKVHGIDVAAQERSPKPGTAMLSMDRPPSKHDFSPSAASRLDFSNFGRSFKPESRESRPNSTTSLDNQSNQPVERPSNEELVKLGMDPEAYCEICKKEFCSKYFLRTHKQNIHGIPPKTDSQESGLTKPLSMAPHLALSTPLLPSNFMGSMSSMGALGSMNSMGALGSMSSMSALGSMGIPPSLSAQTKPMNLSASNHMGSISSGKHRSSSYGQSSKWKEPNNSARVTCDLCNKELCNKYFLRTHKINKHGILPEEMSPATSQNVSPNNSDLETSSNSSIPTDLSIERNLQSPKLNLENSKLFTNKLDDGHNLSEALNLKIKSEHDRNFNNYASEICHLCDRKFKSSKWLRQHILKDHAGLTALSPTMEKAFNIGSRYAPLDQRTCSVCSIVFPSEMSMQLHMIQEHNAQVTIKTEPQSPTCDGIDSKNQFSGTVKKYNIAPRPRVAFSLKQKFYSCSICSQKSIWLSKILSHEKSIHGINHEKKKFCCKSCHKVFRKEKLFRSHMMDIHGDYSLNDNSTSKKYRCTTCDRSFPTALQCHQHIRQDHIRCRSFRINNRAAYQRHTCNQCSFSTRYKKQLQRHVIRCHNVPRKFNQSGLSIEDVNSGNTINSLNLHAEALNGCENGDYTMQTFRIKQCNEDGVFVASIVQMPVLKKLKNSASVSFMVTPLEEH